MIVTVQRVVRRRLVLPVLAILFCGALVVKPFLHYVRRSGFAPFAWYRIVLGGVLLSAVAAGWM